MYLCPRKAKGVAQIAAAPPKIQNLNPISKERAIFLNRTTIFIIIVLAFFER